MFACSQCLPVGTVGSSEGFGHSAEGSAGQTVRSSAMMSGAASSANRKVCPTNSAMYKTVCRCGSLVGVVGSPQGLMGLTVRPVGTSVCPGRFVTRCSGLGSCDDSVLVCLMGARSCVACNLIGYIRSGSHGTDPPEQLSVVATCPVHGRLCFGVGNIRPATDHAQPCSEKSVVVSCHFRQASKAAVGGPSLIVDRYT